MNDNHTPGSEPIRDARTLGLPKMLILGLQHMFAMFGATVLVPILVQGYGLPLSIQTTLLMAGLGTLLFHVCTKFKVPAFLGSSFAYLGGFSAVAALDAGKYAGMDPAVKLQYACGGIVVAGLLYVVLAAIIKLVGVKKVMRFLPPVVTGPIIILIGLNLAPSAVSNASSCWWLAIVAMAIIIVANIWGKGMIKIIPILLGVVGSYIIAVIANAMGATVVDAAGNVAPLIDFSGVAASAPVGLQPFFTDFTGSIAKFDLTSILVMAPIAIAAMMEHIGDMSAISATVGQNFIQEPGLHRTLVGDGIATVYGLDRAVYGELVELDTGVKGMVMNLARDSVGVVLLGSDAGVREGTVVRRTGHPADGRAGHSAQHAAGHPAHGRAAAGQRAGACGQGDLCRMARAGPGLPRGLLL